MEQNTIYLMKIGSVLRKLKLFKLQIQISVTNNPNNSYDSWDLIQISTVILPV